MKTIVLIFFVLTSLIVRAENSGQLTHLPPTKKPRFKVKNISWPQKYGQAEICLWKDDKYAALSITIDDNCRPDHQWWLEQGKKFGFPFTWFVITGNVGRNKTFSGTWEDFIRLKEAGHSIQSHSVTHQNNDNSRSDEAVRDEYKNSKDAIESNIPGNKCLTIAYPWGKGKTALAEEYYIAGRGTVGTPNQVNIINYMNTCGGHLNTQMIDAVLGNPFKEPRWLSNPRYKRGWLSLLHHSVASGSTLKARKNSTAKVLSFLEYAAKNKDKLWIDTFVNVAKYGQERDSATIKILEVTPEKIRFSLGDNMKDSLFDFPLTVKVGLDNSWAKLNVVQSGKPVKGSIIDHNGKKFALIQAVPDAGVIEMFKIQ